MKWRQEGAIDRSFFPSSFVILNLVRGKTRSIASWRQLSPGRRSQLSIQRVISPPTLSLPSFSLASLFLRRLPEVHRRGYR